LVHDDQPVHDHDSAQAPSLQTFFPPLQRPLSQASPLVQLSPSLHDVPVSLVASHVFVASLQLSSVQALPSSQSLSVSHGQT
jgi:hypothetical protein